MTETAGGTTLANSQPPYILTLDVGTSSARALLFDARGDAVEGWAAREAVRVTSDSGGRAELDPDELLISVVSCLDEMVERARSLPGPIAAVCGCSLVGNLMATGVDGAPTTALRIYADTRAAPAVDWLRERVDEAAAHQRTGTLFHPSYYPAQFLWMEHEEPQALAEAHRWMAFGDYLGWTLTGERVVSHSVASWSGLLNRATLDWDEELLAALPVRREQLSKLVDVNQPYGELLPDYAARWPALRRAAWFPWVGDGAAANIGSGCAGPGRLAVSMGTSSALRVALPSVGRVPDGLWCYRVDRERALLGGAMSEGGSIYAWLRRTLALGDGDELDDALRAMPPGAHGLSFLPLVSGERAPGWRADARGAVMGLSLATTPLDLLRAAMEGVACRMALIYRRLKPALAADAEIVASGGALLNSPAWLQMTADALGCPVRAPALGEASARGAALLALGALGLLDSTAQAATLTGPVYEPVPAHTRVYSEMVGELEMMYNCLIAR